MGLTLIVVFSLLLKHVVADALIPYALGQHFSNGKRKCFPECLSFLGFHALTHLLLTYWVVSSVMFYNMLLQSQVEFDVASLQSSIVGAGAATLDGVSHFFIDFLKTRAEKFVPGGQNRKYGFLGLTIVDQTAHLMVYLLIARATLWTF
jgi:hypothetical protein